MIFLEDIVRTPRFLILRLGLEKVHWTFSIPRKLVGSNSTVYCWRWWMRQAKLATLESEKTNETAKS